MADDDQGPSVASGEDDLPDIIDIVMEMGRQAPEARPPEPPSPPLRAPRTWKDSPTAPATMSRRRARPTPGAPMPPTGSIFAPGAAGRILRCCRPIRRSSASTSPRARPERQRETGRPNSVATIERRLSSLSWNYAQRGQPLDRKDRHIATVLAGIRNSHAKPPVQKEAILPEDLDRHAGDARPRHAARPARPGHAAARLCRRPAAFRDRRPRRCQGSDRRRARLGGDSRQGRAGDVARQDRLARGRDRPRLVRRHLPCRGAWKPG